MKKNKTRKTFEVVREREREREEKTKANSLYLYYKKCNRK